MATAISHSTTLSLSDAAVPAPQRDGPTPPHCRHADISLFTRWHCPGWTGGGVANRHFSIAFWDLRLANISWWATVKHSLCRFYCRGSLRGLVGTAFSTAPAPTCRTHSSCSCGPSVWATPGVTCTATRWLVALPWLPLPQPGASPLPAPNRTHPTPCPQPHLFATTADPTPPATFPHTPHYPPTSLAAPAPSHPHTPPALLPPPHPTPHHHPPPLP